MLKEQLIQSGLTEKQATIYLACLELGPAVIAQIAHKSNLNRATVYEVIEELITKRLISISIKGKRKTYVAETPETIKVQLKEKLQKFDTILPELLTLTQKGVKKPTVKYYEGIEGIKRTFTESLNAKDDTIIGFSGIEAVVSQSKALEQFWEEEYIPKRIANKKQVKLIFPDNKTSRKYHAKDQEQLRESKFVPSTYYNFECEIYAYDDVLVMNSYSPGEEFSLTLESKPIVNTLRMIWQLCWNMGY